MPPAWWADRERAREIAGRLNVANAELVDLVAAVVAAKTWSGDGIRSVEHWLMLNAGLSPAHAREVVRIAERRHELPTAADLQRAGQMSLDRADALAKHAPADHDASASRSAAKMTVTQIHQVMGRYVFDLDQPKPEYLGASARADNPPSRRCSMSLADSTSDSMHHLMWGRWCGRQSWRQRTPSSTWANPYRTGRWADRDGNAFASSRARIGRRRGVEGRESPEELADLRPPRNRRRVARWTTDAAGSPSRR
jgi:hypothetical protein